LHQHCLKGVASLINYHLIKGLSGVNFHLSYWQTLAGSPWQSFWLAH
jgi:hypothetical protein